jgi:hypothetical protein
MPIGETKTNLAYICSKVEGILLSKYSEIEAKINANITRIKQNKEKAFIFLENQIQKIGIENIRQSRLQRLFKEKELWTQNFESSKQAVPNLIPLLIVKIING